MNGMGKVGIEFKKRDFDKNAINWKDSNIYKKYLIENNLVPKSWINEHGEEWLIFFTDEYYLRWVWRKKGGRIPNAQWYSFKATSYAATLIDDIEAEVKTIEDITYNTYMGTLQKSLMLSRKFPQIKELYHHGL